MTRFLVACNPSASEAYSNAEFKLAKPLAHSMKCLDPWRQIGQQVAGSMHDHQHSEVFGAHPQNAKEEPSKRSHDDGVSDGHQKRSMRAKSFLCSCRPQIETRRVDQPEEQGCHNQTTPRRAQHSRQPFLQQNAKEELLDNPNFD